MASCEGEFWATAGGVLRWMILPISSWLDGRVSFLLSCLVVALASRLVSCLLSRFWDSAFLLLRLSLGFCLSLMILPMGSALDLDFSLG